MGSISSTMSGCMAGGNKDIQILLSTYNGEKFLRQQLDSYLNMEEFERCCVLIRDDGSTDGTISILKNYENRKNFKIAYGKNLGVLGSYQWLIQNSDPTCSYFAFSDQDDIWKQDKVKKALAQLECCPKGKAALFASYSQITDEKLNPIGQTIAPTRGISFYNAMVQNILPGHTQVFNLVLRNYLCRYGLEGAAGVDWWTYLMASALGTVVFEPSCTVLHRQHGNNAVGYRINAQSLFWRRLHYVLEGKGNTISQQIKAFYTLLGDEIPDVYRREMEEFLEGTKNVMARLHYLKISRVYRQNKHDDWKFRLLYLLGKYRLAKSQE